MSLEYCEKFGKHHDLVGYHFINIADIIIKKSNITLPLYLLEDMRQEAICEMLRMLNRMNEEYISRIDDIYNYMYRVAVKAIFTQVKEIRHNNRVMAGIVEFIESEKMNFIIEETL